MNSLHTQSNFSLTNTTWPPSCIFHCLSAGHTHKCFGFVNFNVFMHFFYKLTTHWLSVLINVKWSANITVLIKRLVHFFPIINFYFFYTYTYITRTLIQRLSLTDNWLLYSIAYQVSHWRGRGCSHCVRTSIRCWPLALFTLCTLFRQHCIYDFACCDVYLHVVCLSVCLSHSCTLLKPLYAMRCHLAGTLM